MNPVVQNESEMIQEIRRLRDQVENLESQVIYASEYRQVNWQLVAIRLRTEMYVMKCNVNEVNRIFDQAVKDFTRPLQPSYEDALIRAISTSKELEKSETP